MEVGIFDKIRQIESNGRISLQNDAKRGIFRAINVGCPRGLATLGQIGTLGNNIFS